MKKRFLSTLFMLIMIIGSCIGCGKMELNVGDVVIFGNYEQDNDSSNGQEPIKWQVVDVNDGKALLVSYYVLDNLEYNEHTGIYGDDNSESFPWSSSYIYSWLNNNFLNVAFNSKEQEVIVDTTVYTDDIENVEVIGSVFLLSYEDILKYYNTDTIKLTHFYSKGEYECSYSNELLCKPTPYAVDRGLDTKELTQEDINVLKEDGFKCDLYKPGDTYAGYWLRSSLCWDSWFTAEGHALWVEEDGRIEIGLAGFSNTKTTKHGVRPCVWVNLDDVDKYLSIADSTEETWLTETKEEEISNNSEESEREETTNNGSEFGWEVKNDTLYIWGNCVMEDWNPESTGIKAPWWDEKDFTKVVIEEGIENIGAYAFYQCDNLVEIEIAKSVTSIGRNAFAECNSLENVYIPDNVKNIGYRMFENCENLTTVRLPNEAVMGSGVFEGCVSLISVNLPENMDAIGGYMFKGCKSLTSIDIPESVTRVEDFAFAHCTSLTNIEIPESVTYIGENAFIGCTAIDEIK